MLSSWKVRLFKFRISFIFKNEGLIYLMANRVSFDGIPSFLQENLILKRTAQEIFKNLHDNYEKHQTITDQDLISLSSFFGETFERALEIIENNKITFYYTCSDKVGIYKVDGSSFKTYLIYSSVNYCPCSFYKYQVSGGSHTFCKHVLATVIADITGKRQSIQVSDDHLKDLVLESFSTINLIILYQVLKMNEEDWPNRNPYIEQFMCLPREMPSLFNTVENTNHWVQIPPQTMPWGFPPESHPAIVKFTAGDCNKYPASIKRKGAETVDMPPPKILVSEEKMAAHMKGLHISDVEPNSSTLENVDYKNNANKSERLPRLVISDEIKNLKSESIIPDAILKKMEKPEMALVLWHPPATDLQSRLEELKKLSKKTENEEKEATSKVKNKEEKDMEVIMDAEIESNNENSTFRPIIQMPPLRNQYHQPPSQLHGFPSFS